MRRARGRKTSGEIETVAERVAGRRVHVIVHHADEREEGEKPRAEIGVRFDCAELYLMEFTPGMGVHAGPGVLAISFYAD